MANLRINSVRSKSERGSEAYFTPIEAVLPLIALEMLPKKIHEPACGDGAIAIPLRGAGMEVRTSDIFDYGLPGTVIRDYLCDLEKYEGSEEEYQLHRNNDTGMITNPPFTLAREFAYKGLMEHRYVALLLRLNWLETPDRAAFFKNTGLSRILVSSRRLPMMHRYGYTGHRAPSNCAYAWYIWDHRGSDDEEVGWNKLNPDPIIRFFDWLNFAPRQKSISKDTQQKPVMEEVKVDELLSKKRKNSNVFLEVKI